MSNLLVNGPGDCCQGEPLEGIKEFVKIAGIPTLEKYLPDAKKKGHRLWKYFITKSRE